MAITGVAVAVDPDLIAQSGIPVAADGSAPGSLVDEPGQLQYGNVLFGAGSRAGWRNLVGWRGVSGADVSDTPRPQTHGAYAGDVFAGSATVTFDYLVRGKPDAKAAALDVIEANTPIDGVARPLVVDDGTGPWVRMARVVARDVPEDAYFRHAPVQCSIQWVCADPRRYSLRGESLLVTMPTSEGGLDYPLDYTPGLDYGVVTNSYGLVDNRGSAWTPLRLVLRGPLTTPAVRAGDQLLEFDLNLAASETLHVDSDAGSVLLNGSADRLAHLTNRSTPIERFQLPVGSTEVQLSAAAGTGSVSLSWNHARL